MCYLISYITTILKVNKHLFSQNFEATSEFHPYVVSVLSYNFWPIIFSCSLVQPQCDVPVLVR
jgi:hypothetical protein